MVKTHLKSLVSLDGLFSNTLHETWPIPSLCPVVYGLWLHVENVLLSVRAPSARLLDDERRRVALVEQTQLPVRRRRVVRVQEDAAVHQGAVKVGDERADVSDKKIIIQV